jgi:hypothetical protein
MTPASSLQANIGICLIHQTNYLLDQQTYGCPSPVADGSSAIADLQAIWRVDKSPEL